VGTVDWVARGTAVGVAAVQRGLARTALLGLSLSAGCGVFWGEPIELFPESGTANDGGVRYDSEEACIETVEPIVQGIAITGARVTALQALAEGKHNSAARWSDETKSRVAVTLTDLRFSSVRSRANPRREFSTRSTACAHHVRIDAQVEIDSVDGRLAESFERVRFIAFSEDELRAEFTLAGDAYSGTYEPSLRREHCFVSSVFRLLISTEGSHGSITDNLSAAACSDAGAAGVEDFAGGNWGTRWQNY